MARTATANGSVEAAKKDFERHAGQIRKDISALAESITDAGVSITDNAKSGASAKADELRQVSDETIRELRAQLATIEKQVGTQVRERPITALAAAAGVGFLIAMLARR